MKMDIIALIFAILIAAVFGFGVALIVYATRLNRSNNLGDDGQIHFDRNSYTPGLSKDLIPGNESSFNDYIKRALSPLTESEEFVKYKEISIGGDLNTPVERYILPEDELLR